MKRIGLSVAGLLALMLLFISTNVSAAEVESGTIDSLQWTYSEGELTIAGNGPIEDFLSLKDAPWAHLSEDVYMITIEEGVTSIGDCSFCLFSNLTTVQLPDSLERIGVAAFSGCDNLSWIMDSDLNQAIPDGVRIIDIGAFANCTSISNLKLGSSVIYIGPSAFSDCYGLGQITLSPCLETLDNFAFYNCNNLTEIVIPGSVTSIGEQTFLGCIWLRTIRFIGDAPNIHENAFNSYTTAYYPEDNETWTADKLVDYGGVLTWEAIPADCIGIGYCGDNVSWKLKQSGELIISGTGAMYDYDTIDYPPWYSLKEHITSVRIEMGVTAVGSTAFYKCTEIEQVSLADSIISLGDSAFSDCDSLTDIYIGSNIASISRYAFLSCDSLQGFEVADNNLYFTNDAQGCLYNKEMTKLLNVPCTLSGHLVVPDGIQIIEHEAAHECINISSVEIPSTVTTIGNGAFLFCKSLTSVVIPSSVTLIDHGAFWCCMSLRDIRFTGNAPEFGNNVFVWVEATAVYPMGNATWTEDKFIHNDSNITWIAERMETEAFCVPGLNNALFDTLEDALAAYNPATQYIMLLRDVTVDTKLQKDLNLDLNGYKLEGKLQVGDYKIYGMDSTTDQYTCDQIGYFYCVDETGNRVVPVIHFRSTVTGTAKRYLSILDENGYSFHRFYLGITHRTLRPATTAVGYKAVFYGDEMVASQLDPDHAFGYSMQLEGHNPVSAFKGRDSFKSGKVLTLRLDNYDVEHYGEAELSAKVVLQLSDGTVIESSESKMTMRSLLEMMNDMTLSAEQKANIKTMIEKYPIIKSWDTANLYS